MMKLLKSSPFIYGLVFCSVFFASFSTYSYAYNNEDNWSCKWSNVGSINYKFISSTPTDYQSVFTSAISQWNATPTKVWITQSSSSYNTFGIYNLEGNEYGRTSYTCSFPTYQYINSSDVGLNNLYFYNNPYRKADLQRKVALHEVGHFIGLGHSTVSENAVMKQGPYYDYNQPYPDDINGVKSIYP